MREVQTGELTAGMREAQTERLAAGTPGREDTESGCRTGVGSRARHTECGMPALHKNRQQTTRTNNTMKAVFLSYNQALTDRVHAILDEQGIRGFTKWALTQGRGSVDGEPHYGTHAWPSMNASILAIIDDEQLEPLMTALRELDASTPMQGSRAFYWTVEGGF